MYSKIEAISHYVPKTLSHANIAPSEVVLTVILLVMGLPVVRAIYNITLHPLAKVPGPKYAAVSEAFICWLVFRGRFVWDVDSLHRKYGPIVRIAPNQISFSRAKAIKDIHAPTGKANTFIKGPTYRTPDVKPHLVSDPNIEHHARTRKLFANAFSTKALSEQEALVQGHITGFLQQLHKLGKTNDGLNMSRWFELVTFDIISDLMFGKSFESVQSGIAHPMVSIMLENVVWGTRMSVLLRLSPLFAPLLPLLAKDQTRKRMRFLEYTRNAVRIRVNTKTDRPDFMTKVLMDDERMFLDEDDLVSNAQIILIAGSETTATFFTGSTYWLLQTPKAYAKLKEEIRTRFSSLGEINSASVGSLPYLNAVIDEGLRIFPPAPLPLERISPGAMVDGMYIPRGTQVAVNCVSESRGEEHFHEPHKFIPERWIDQDCCDTKVASQPFIMGTRGCIGRNLAYMEMRLVLAKMHFLFDLQYVGDEGLDWDTQCRMWTLWSKPDLPVKFSLREGVAPP